MTAGADVIGTGVDLVENARMREVLERWGLRFKARVFLPAEQSYCDQRASPWVSYGGRFAVKEAVSKAFGTGIGPHISWLDIEVVRDLSSGAPSVRFSEKGTAFARSHGVDRVLVSLSHSHDFAVAHALLVGKLGRKGRSEGA